MQKPIELKIKALRLPLKTSFKQASFTRSTGESIWVIANRGNITGYGEGCPRPYVTGETISSGLQWLEPQLADLQDQCNSLSKLQEKVEREEAAIDQNPAAWCGIETALLDLFAREQQCSVEKMLGLKDPNSIYQYTAVLGDSSSEKFEALLQRYLKWGFTNFKIKASGALQKDQWKLKTVQEAAENNKLKKYSIRLDANNLWSGKTQTAISYLAQLNVPLLGIEEPVEAKNPKALEEISTKLNQAIILDESLCNRTDLKAYDSLKGTFIANIKISRLGGVLRSLKMVDALKKRNWRMIIGAHVGETSVMTRAGICVAQAAGSNLIGQEGCFGNILLENEPVLPSLKFGAGGRLDLSRAYQFIQGELKEEVGVNNWKLGWGLRLIET